MQKIKDTNHRLHAIDKPVLVELRFPEWMREELNVRAIRAHQKRSDYVKGIVLAAWDQEKTKE
jgi:hypothetical protein